MVLQTTAELVVAAFIVWRVFGLAATLIALGWRAYRERRAARWRVAFAEMVLRRHFEFREQGLVSDDADHFFRSKLNARVEL